MLTRTKGDWEGWLQFFLKGIYEVSRQATDTARKIIALREYHRQIINDRNDRFPSAFNALKLLDRLYDAPIITVKTVQEMMGLSKPSANVLVANFERAGLLSQINPGRRNRVFGYTHYLDLFLDEASPEILLPKLETSTTLSDSNI